MTSTADGPRRGRLRLAVAALAAILLGLLTRVVPPHRRSSPATAADALYPTLVALA